MSTDPLTRRATVAAAHGDCRGAILCGGGARRYGGAAKGLERVGGRRIVDRAAGALAQATDGLLLIGGDIDAADDPALAGATLVPDSSPGSGPLAALADALEVAGTPVLLVAWDMPFVSAALLGELRRLGEAGGHAALVPDGGPAAPPQPLCAYYAPPAGIAARALLARGERSLQALLAQLPAARLPLQRVLDFGDPRRLFFSVNTPADREAAELLLQAPLPRASRG